VTAAELYEIVKDVPEDIHPDAYFDPYSGRWHATETDRPITTTLAETAFVGSMVLHLISEGYHDFEWSGDSDEGTVTLTFYDQQFTATTELGCLAAACKEARP